MPVWRRAAPFVRPMRPDPREAAGEERGATRILVDPVDGGHGRLCGTTCGNAAPGKAAGDFGEECGEKFGVGHGGKGHARITAMSGHRTIGAGANLVAISEEEGFWAETIWQHPENAELKKQRHFYNVLSENDSVFIPEKRPKTVGCVTDRRHVFRRKGIPALLKLRVLVENKPCADRKYSLVVDGVEYTGVTDGEGRLQHHVPAGAQRGHLLLEGSVTLDLTLSTLQPVSGILGVQNRLRNLGFYRGPRDGELNNEMREAIRRVQAHFDWKETGEIDGKLRELLEQLHDRSSEHLKEDKDYG